MKFVIGAEIDAEVYESFRPARKVIQDLLNQTFEDHDYGDGLPKFHFLVIMRKDNSNDYPEVFNFNAKKKKCDYRVNVNMDDFLASSDNGRVLLICAALYKAIEHLAKESSTSIDVSKLQMDFSSVHDQFKNI